ncbi:prepilin-type N-terminal cleavage/methylation domain-containing protein [Clostridiales Family XIII bacterium PM5-7]
MEKIRSKKGFTLGELLIVVAIISILVAISIPIFAGNKKEAELVTCQANRRALRGEMITEYIAGVYGDLDSAFTALYAAHEDEYVCPNKGTFTWNSTGAETGSVKCSHHDGDGSGDPQDPDPDPDDTPKVVGTIPGTDIPFVENYWPKPSDWDNLNNWDLITVSPKGVFQYDDGNFYIVVMTDNLGKNSSAKGPGGFTTWLTVKLTSKVITYQGNEHYDDLIRGDLCRHNGKYYVYIDNGGWVFSPTREPNRWYALT